MTGRRSEVREPQQDRSRATRQRLLESTIELLAVHGWAGSTVAEVAEHAGVSRGAAQHHYPTREDLITGALEYMFDGRMTELRGGAAEIGAGPSRTLHVVQGVVDHFTGNLFKAALQVWTAAAADEQLRARIVPLEAKFGRHAHRTTIEMLGADDADPVVHTLVQATLDMARGLGLADVLTDDSARRERIVRQWADTLHTALDSAGAGRSRP
ncbi:TetR/AcrR family transcriptional regulator [Tomitella cavernea]|uniref:TetR family transcriptional regulator n=1 Tax=Tomitella cavernea TaxID=1387982 RepID=A0ABP9CEK2_9ACTN|nr:TetR/AcrR family transcriptional regulator [Tomitella cavernea]